MTHFRALILRCYLHRCLGLLALGASTYVGGQSLNLAVKDPVLPETGLLARSTSSASDPGSVTGNTLALAASDTAAAASRESSSSPVSEVETLPESPSAILASAGFVATQPIAAEPQFNTLNSKSVPKTADGRPIAPLYTKYIPPDWAYQPIHGREKLILGARDLYSPSNIAAIFISAGFSHLVNGQPNYGVSGQAFAKRLGATAIRETAEGIFTDGVFSVMFHQDPRYFAEGPKYNVFHRAIYAATRPIIVRTTNGTGSTVNSSLLAGYAAATLLNNAYYPQINRNVKDNFTSFGGSIGGAALGFVVSEFTDDALYFLHLKHKP